MSSICSAMVVGKARGDLKPVPPSFGSKQTGTWTLDTVAPEVAIDIASFLSVQDVCELQYTCKYLRKALHLTNLAKASLNTFDEVSGWSQPDDLGILWQTFGRLFFQDFARGIHAVKFSFDFECEGRGARRGRVFILERPNNSKIPIPAPGTVLLDFPNEDNMQPIGSCCFYDFTIIHMSPLADFEETRCNLWFRPRKGYSYVMAFKVGGASRNRIYVTNISLQSAIYSVALPLAKELMETLPDTSFFMDLVIAALGDEVKCTDAVKSLFKLLSLDVCNEKHVERMVCVVNELRLRYATKIEQFASVDGNRHRQYRLVPSSNKLRSTKCHEPQQRCSLNSLPQEIYNLIVSFVPIEDALHLQNTCAFIYSSLNLGILEKAGCNDICSLYYAGIDYGNTKRLCMLCTFAPFFLQELNPGIHTIKLSFFATKCDATLFILERPDSSQNQNPHTDTLLFEFPLKNAQILGQRCKFGYTVIKEISIGKSGTECMIDGVMGARFIDFFKPKRGFSYGIGYIGNRKGDSCRIFNVKVQSFVHSAALNLANLFAHVSPSDSLLSLVTACLDEKARCASVVLTLFQSMGIDIRIDENIGQILRIVNAFKRSDEGSRIDLGILSSNSNMGGPFNVRPVQATDRCESCREMMEYCCAGCLCMCYFLFCLPCFCCECNITRIVLPTHRAWEPSRWNQPTPDRQQDFEDFHSDSAIQLQYMVRE